MFTVKPIGLRRVYASPKLAIYEGDDGGRYLLKRVGRKYELLYEAHDESVPHFLSELKPTEMDGVFHGDAKPLTGKRMRFSLELQDDGIAWILPRTPQRKKRVAPVSVM